MLVMKKRSSQYDTAVNSLKDNLTFFTSLSIDDFAQEAKLGSLFNFKDGEEIFAELTEISNRLLQVNLYRLPLKDVTDLYNLAATLKGPVNSIKGFDPSKGDPAGQRVRLLNEFRTHFQNFYDAAIKALSINLVFSDDITNERLIVSETKDEILQLQKEAQNRLEQIQGLLDAAKQAAGEVGVAKHSSLFQLEANEHATQSKNWFIATLAVLIIAILTGVLFMTAFKLENPDPAEVVQYSISKIVILTALFYGLSICLRNYKAHRHNQIVNKHRQNALNTFETFSKASGDDIQTKNAVLLEATRTIFSNQQTGYLPSDSDGDSPNKIIEIFKNSGGPR
jgi:hypothetical protein